MLKRFVLTVRIAIYYCRYTDL